MERARILAVIFLVALALPASAGQLLVRIQGWGDQTVGFAQPPEPSAVFRREYNAAYTRSLLDGEQRFSYSHQPILIRAGETAHNAYLHQFDAYMLHEGLNWQMEFTAGVHGSSNIFKYSRYHREALVGSFSAMHVSNLPIIDYFGVSGDHRFGNFRIYPRVTRELPLADGHLLIDFPTGLLLRHNQPSWQFGIERYGEKWGALDAERELKSAVYVQEWRIGGWHRIRFFNDILIEAGAGISFDGRMTYVDLEAGQQTRKLGSTKFFSLGVIW
jgi:hypothetical protein